MRTSENEDIFTTWSTELDDYGATLIYLCGELDASTAPTFLSDLQNVAARQRHVILDVHLLSYIDSTGVAAIMSVRSTLQSAGKKLYLVGCHGLLTKILHIMRFDTELRCFEDLDPVLAELGST